MKDKKTLSIFLFGVVLFGAVSLSFIERADARDKSSKKGNKKINTHRTTTPGYESYKGSASGQGVTPETTTSGY